MSVNEMCFKELNLRDFLRVRVIAGDFLIIGLCSQ